MPASLRQAISACIRALLTLVSGARYALMMVDAPGDLECDMFLAGEQVEYLVLLTRRE